MENNFNESLIKGRIVENIFELMFRETRQWDILPLGYEYVTPELAQYQHLAHVKEIYENIRHLPDFVIINSKDKGQMHFVEVKYRSHPSYEDNLKIVEEILSHYKQVMLFLAAPDKFYFETCEKVKKNFGRMNGLAWVEKDIQEKYLKLLGEFIKTS